MEEFKEGSKRDETIISALSLYDGLVWFLWFGVSSELNWIELKWTEISDKETRIYLCLRLFVVVCLAC
jgi:hypothetical protein